MLVNKFKIKNNNNRNVSVRVQQMKKKVLSYNMSMFFHTRSWCFTFWTNEGKIVLKVIVSYNLIKEEKYV